MFARTDRLILRPSWPEDVAPLARALGNAEVARGLLNVPAPYGEADAAQWIAQSHDRHLPRLLAFLRTRGAPRLVGGCAIQRREDGVLELGYWIERGHWGLGFATEATRAVMRVARASGLKVRAAHFLDNPAPARVLGKIGFRPTGSVEMRHSRARAADAAMALYEDEGGDRTRPDEAFRELYGDVAPDGGPVPA